MPCVGCPWVSKDLKGQTCLTAHCFFLCSPLNNNFHAQLSKHSPFIDLRRQRRTNTWSLKQRTHSARWRQAFPDLPSLVKMQVGRGNIWSLNQTTNYSIINEIWVTQHPCCFQNISSTNLHQF